ncbi:MAG: polyphenol oxidase family protein, partial [Pseudobdellovibrio sp.]
ELKTDHVLIYFGKAKTTLDDLYKLYPNLIFKSVHQIHSDKCVKAQDISTPLPQADALYTSDVGVALVIKTADCMPIMVFDQTSKKILAIHAGWKGVVNEITAKSIQAADLKDVHVYIGPHITQNSFEVKSDAEALLRSVYQKYSG